MSSHSNAPIDYIFSNLVNPDIISGNLAVTISGHLPQFAIIPNMSGNISGIKSNIYERDWSKFDRGNFILDYFTSVVETTKKRLRYLHKHFSDYLVNESNSTIFLQPTDKEEVANIILSQQLC